MPWPASVTAGSGSVPIDPSFSVAISGAGARDARVQAAVQRLFYQLARQTGIPTLPHVLPAETQAVLNIVVERKDHKPPQQLGDDERYSLEVSSGHIRISGDEPLGALRGIQTFLQLVQQNTTAGGTARLGFSAPAVTIQDEPRFGWRGLSLDVSRHFLSVDVVKRTLDGMAAVKLDVLHWHLSDDQGFRIESKKYPKLQQYGSNGLYYTQAEVREIISYARDRGIRIVPEFDMPGHAQSWLPGYPTLGVNGGSYEIGGGYGILSHLLDPTKESTYKFLDRFIGEMAALFPDQYFHIGGDEVDPTEWNDSPQVRAFMQKHHLADGKALQTYFNQRVLKIVMKHHKRMVGWDEVLQPDLPKSVVIQSWRGQKSLWQAAREGYQGILSAGYYLDLMYPASYHYSVDPLKTPPPAPGPREDDQNEAGPPPGAPTDLSPEQQKLILGGEAAMWEELATGEIVDSRLWPRLAAIAERFWSPEAITSVPSMYARLEVTNRWLQWFGLTQRTGPELMRQRLAGPFPYQPLDSLASILEPVKGYSRHAERYTTISPLNQLVDSIAPESDAAREFRDAVDAYLAALKGQRNGAILRQELTTWAQAASNSRAAFQQESLLTPDLPVVDAVSALCKTGEEALDYLDSGNPPPADWKQRNLAVVTPFVRKRVGDILVQIAPGVQKLVEAS